MSIKWAGRGIQRELQLPWGGSRADFEMQPDATRGRAFGGFPKWAKPRETQGKWAIRGGPAGGGSEVDFEMQPDATRADAREAFREVRPARKTLKNACKTQNRGLLGGAKKWGGSHIDFEMQPNATRGQRELTRAGPIPTRSEVKTLQNTYIFTLSLTGEHTGGYRRADAGRAYFRILYG